MSQLFKPGNEKNIPQELKNKRQWTNWRLEPDPVKDRKVPVKVRNGKLYRQSGEPETTTFEQALHNVRTHPELGLGIYLRDGLVGFDADNLNFVLNQGDLPKELRGIVKTADTYCEISPSWTGIHILGMCDEDLSGYMNKNTAKGYELYSDRRFFTVTGESINGKHLNPNTAFSKLAATFLGQRTEEIEVTAGNSAFSNKSYGWKGTVSEFAEYMDNRKLDPAKEAQLWHADEDFLCQEYPAVNEASGVGYDPSSVDLGLINCLAFYWKDDIDKIEEVFKLSPWYASRPGAGKLDARRAGGTLLRKNIRKSTSTYTGNVFKDKNAVGEGDGAVGEEPEKQLDNKKKLLTLLPQLPTVMQAVHKHMLACSPYPQPIFCMFSTLFMFGAMINRYAMVENLGPNMQIKLLGPTGSGKDLPIKYPAHVLRELQAAFVLDEVTSAAGLEDALFENDGNAVRITDEDRALAAGLTSEFTLKLSDYESKVYSAVGGTIVQRARSSGSVAKQYDPIANPFYAKLGAATPGASFNDTSWARALSGEGSRTLYVLTDASRPYNNPTPEPIKVLPQMEDWYASYLPEIPIGEAVKPRRLKFTTDAQEIIDKTIADVDQELRIPHLEEIERALLARVCEYGKRFAMIYALAENPRVKRISPKWAQLGVDTALRYYNFSKQFMIKELLTRRPQLKHTDHVQVLEKMQYILRHLSHYKGLDTYSRWAPYLEKKWVPRTMLLQQCNVDKRSMDSIRDTLVDSGVVKEETEKLPGKRKGVIVWKLSKRHNG